MELAVWVLRHTTEAKLKQTAPLVGRCRLTLSNPS